MRGRRRAAGRRPGRGCGGVLLVFLDRDDRGDPALAQVGAVGRRRVRLVGQRPGGPGPRPSLAAAGDADLLQQRDELRAVAVLARGQDPADRTAPPVSGQVDLGAEPTTGQRVSAPVPADTIPLGPLAAGLGCRSALTPSCWPASATAARCGCGISIFINPCATLCADVGGLTRQEWKQDAAGEPQPRVC